jgi:histidyl-tRNA synthetase
MENNKFSLPRGTADILPENVGLWQSLESRAREVLANYNYKEIRTPLFEETELFARSMGQTSDVVQKQMLTLQPNQREGETGQSSKIFSLRPEGTASVVRAYVENHFDKKEALTKFFYIGPMFRGERPQKGRLRQFHQIGVEAIGPESASPYLDAEVIALSLELLKALGVKEYTLKINSLGSPEDKKNFSKMLRDFISKDKAQLCPTCQDRLDRNVFRILDCKNKSCQSLVQNLSLSTAFLSEESKKYYTQVKENLRNLNIIYQEVPTLVRGLDYYTQIVFEITSASLGSQDALGAGGRYDGLIKELGGSEEVDGIGFSLGLERILLAQQESLAIKKEQPLDVFIVTLDESLLEKGFKLLSSLREKNIVIDMSYKVSSLKSQMRLADKMAARYVALLGQDELAQGVVTLKNMATGNQEKVAFDAVVQKVNEDRKNSAED